MALGEESSNTRDVFSPGCCMECAGAWELECHLSNAWLEGNHAHVTMSMELAQAHIAAGHSFSKIRWAPKVEGLQCANGQQ